jgi:hypothetical protein
MTTLMIKTHNQTGLKYFCKSTKVGVALEKYKGSGTYWKRHIKKHGYDVTTEIYARININNDDISDVALDFSLKNNIVKSKEWANLIPENGLDGIPTVYINYKDILKFHNIPTKWNILLEYFKIGKHIIKSEFKRHKCNLIINRSRRYVHIDINKLYNLIFSNTKLIEISLYFNCDKDVIKDRITTFNIPCNWSVLNRRTKNYIQPDVVKQLNKKMSVEAIGRFLECDPKVIRNLLN